MRVLHHRFGVTAASLSAGGQVSAAADGGGCFHGVFLGGRAPARSRCDNYIGPRDDNAQT